MNYPELCISGKLSLREAMKKLDVTEYKILFVIIDDKLVATLTDGDIRRHLLDGGKLEDRVELAGNSNPRIASNLEQAKAMYHKKNYIAIPIVDEFGRITDVYFGNKEFLKLEYDLNVPVVINAGGKGTRLDPFTRVLPKPLIPVGDLPIIEHIMKCYKGFGCEDFSVIVNYKKELIKAYFNESEVAYNVSWYDEDKPLGTGGGLSLLKGKLNETFFFTNCDILLQSNYDSMLRFHRESNNAITMVCAYKNLTIPYGVVEMGKNGTIESMKEKPEFSFLTNTGMYIVEPEVLEDIEDDMPIAFPDIVDLQKQKGRNVAIYPVSESEWLDMGQLSELEKMRTQLYGE